MRKAALETIGQMVEEDPKVIFVGSDLGAGTLDEVRDKHPERILMEGIAEQHLVGFAAGLALEGFVPFVHTISTFLTRRAFEQVAIDVALDSLPVILVGAGGGVVYAPLGPTHQAIDDFALMTSIPGMTVAAPADPLEMDAMLRLLRAQERPAYVRIAKGGEPVITSELPVMKLGKMRLLARGDKVAILTSGALVHECLSALNKLGKDRQHISLAHFPFISPLDREAILSLSASHLRLVVIEEHIPQGGLSSAVANLLAKTGFLPPLTCITLPNSYSSKYGSQTDHWGLHGMDAEGIASTILELLDQLSKPLPQLGLNP